MAEKSRAQNGGMLALQANTCQGGCLATFCLLWLQAHLPVSFQLHFLKLAKYIPVTEVPQNKRKATLHCGGQTQEAPGETRGSWEGQETICAPVHLARLSANLRACTCTDGLFLGEHLRDPCGHTATILPLQGLSSPSPLLLPTLTTFLQSLFLRF